MTGRGVGALIAAWIAVVGGGLGVVWHHANRPGVAADAPVSWPSASRIAGIGVALIVSPRTWLGTESEVHLHVWAAVLLGGAITGLPVYLALTRSGWGGTRHVIAAAQMLWAGLLIHLTGGRLESHFHIFGSLALIAFYRDWRVLLTATVVTAADHFIRGVAWPQSLYGVATESTWRWTEHAFWVVFENAFLAMASLQGVQEMRNIAGRQAELETVNHAIDQQVQARTRELSERGAELTTSNQELDAIVQKLQSMQEELMRSGKTVAVAAEEHQRSTVRQSTAVEQTRQTMQSLAAASSRIASLAQEVAGHAAQSRSASLALGDRTRELIDASSRMGTLLESVKEIATKSELLALNAALEGARSGEAGRGFSLVAAQMQRLAESVAASVRDIQVLLEEVRRAGQAGAVAAAGAGRRSAPALRRDGEATRATGGRRGRPPPAPPGAGAGAGRSRRRGDRRAARGALPRAALRQASYLLGSLMRQQGAIGEAVVLYTRTLRVLDGGAPVAPALTLAPDHDVTPEQVRDACRRMLDQLRPGAPPR